MNKYKYAKLVYCGICGGKHRSLKERGKNKYICLKYSLSRKCDRNLISEEEIDELVKRHSSQSPIRKIIVYKDKVIITYEDNTHSFMSYNRIIF